MKQNFTKTYIDKLPLAVTGQQVLWDNKLAGFGLVVGKVSKTFVVQATIKGRTKRKSIGKYHERMYPLVKARKDAEGLLAQLHHGVVPWEVEKAAQIQADIAKGATYKDAFDDYIKLKKDASVETLRGYANTLQYLEAWWDIQLGDITPRMARSMHSEISDRGKYIANSVFRVFRAVYNSEMKVNFDLPRNPADAVEWNKESRRKNAIPAAALSTFWRLLNETENDVRRDVWRLGLFTGLRRTSACSIRTEHVDLANKTLHIPSPKGGSDYAFDLPLPNYVVTLIRKRIEANGDSIWLFPSATSASGHITEPKEPRIVAQMALETGYDKLTFHALRSTFISVAGGLELPPYTIKLLANHALPQSGDVTEGYMSLLAEQLRKSMQRISVELIKHVRAGR